MEIFKTRLEGLFLIVPTIYEDNRGMFFETYNKNYFAKAGINDEIFQENESFSKKGVIRGLHFQVRPFEQGKIISVVRGNIKDVVVDIRENSSTYGQWESFSLNSKEKMSLYVPRGFAHGFLALEDSVLNYKITTPYNKASESGIIWNDLSLNIDWGISNPILSEKDKNLSSFKDYRHY